MTRVLRASVAGFGALLLFAATAAAQNDARPTVAVMYFNNGAMGKANADFEPLSKGVADILITEFQHNPSIRVVERQHLQKLLEEQNLTTLRRVDDETAVRVGKLLGAQHMILGGFVVDLKGKMRIDARAVNVETSRVEYVETITDQSEQILDMIAALALKMNRGMKLPNMPARERPSSGSSSESDKTRRFQAMMLYSRALVEEDNRNSTQAVALYKQFLDRCPKDDCADQRVIAMRKVRELEARSSEN